MAQLNILILDDEQRVRDELGEFLGKLGFNVLKAELPSIAFQILKANEVDLCILDIRLPEMDGLSVLKKVKEEYPDIEVVMISGHGDMNSVIEAMRLGASDFFSKPFRLMDVQNAIQRTHRFIQLQQRLKEVEQDYDLLSTKLQENSGAQFIGNSEAVKNVVSLMSKVAKAENTSVLITGESGTGKELVASGIHYLSARRNKYFYAVNSTAVPEHLLESMFFGHTKGAFTGATEDKKGLFEEANNSTLFLDEIGDMQLNLQSKMLRVLEERKFCRVGSHKEISTDVRIIAATNQDLEKMAMEKKFRLDLYHRLSSIVIRIPPLRERLEDIPILVPHFVKSFSEKMNKPIKEIDPRVYNVLYDYAFPGNIRELRNMVERALIISEGGKILPKHFGPFNGKNHATIPQSQVRISDTFELAKIERDAIMRALQQVDYNKTKAAKLLKITWQSLHRKMTKYQIEDQLQ